MFHPVEDLSTIQLIAERQVLQDLQRALNHRIQSLGSCSTELALHVQDAAIEASTYILDRMLLISDDLSQRTQSISVAPAQDPSGCRR